jgi:hypothetical protein
VVADIAGLNDLTVDPALGALIRDAGGPDVTGVQLATFSTRTELAAAATPEPNEMGFLALGLIRRGCQRYNDETEPK